MDLPIPEKYSGTPAKLVVLGILTIFIVLLTIFCLSNNIQIVFTHLYYIPIILAAYWFTKRGIIYAVCVAVFYLGAVVTLGVPGSDAIIAATGRAVIFIAIACVIAILSLTIHHQRQEIEQSEKKFRGIWEHIQAGIILMDASSHTILAANPEVQKMTGFTEAEMKGHICHKFICPAEEGKCPISDLGLTVEHAERVILSRDGTRIPVLKTVTVMKIAGADYFIESFIDITPIKEAENTLLAYLREATLRIRNPVELVRDNLADLSGDLRSRETNPEYIATALAIQQKNMDDILNNLREIERAVAEKRTEIPDELRKYLMR